VVVCIVVDHHIGTFHARVGITGDDMEQVLAARDAELAAGLRTADNARKRYLWSFVMPALAGKVIILYDAVGIKAGVVCTLSRLCVCGTDLCDLDSKQSGDAIGRTDIGPMSAVRVH
jgi:hypothetical protein